MALILLSSATANATQSFFSSGVVTPNEYKIGQAKYDKDEILRHDRKDDIATLSEQGNDAKYSMAFMLLMRKPYNPEGLETQEEREAEELLQRAMLLGHIDSALILAVIHDEHFGYYLISNYLIHKTGLHCTTCDSAITRFNALEEPAEKESHKKVFNQWLAKYETIQYLKKTESFLDPEVTDPLEYKQLAPAYNYVDFKEKKHLKSPSSTGFEELHNLNYAMGHILWEGKHDILGGNRSEFYRRDMAENYWYRAMQEGHIDSALQKALVAKEQYKDRGAIYPKYLHDAYLKANYLIEEKDMKCSTCVAHIKAFNILDSRRGIKDAEMSFKDWLKLYNNFKEKRNRVEK